MYEFPNNLGNLCFQIIVYFSFWSYLFYYINVDPIKIHIGFVLKFLFHLNVNFLQTPLHSGISRQRQAVTVALRLLSCIAVICLLLSVSGTTISQSLRQTLDGQTSSSDAGHSNDTRQWASSVSFLASVNNILMVYTTTNNFNLFLHYFRKFLR